MVYHGGSRDIRDGTIDFSYSTNPYRPRFIERYLKMAQFEKYPYCEDELEKEIKSKFGIEGEVTIGAGITELLYMVAHATRKSPSVIMKHTYGEYERVSGLFEKPVHFIDSLDPGVGEFLGKKNSTIFFANPNNPTGKLYDYISELIDGAERNNSTLILDESFISFADRKPKYSFADNLIVLRSFTKEYNVPGIRIGYAISTGSFKKKLVEYRMPWGIGAAGCMAIKAILENRGYLKSTLPKIKNERKRLEKKLGLRTDANFFLADVEDAAKITRQLVDGGVLVRDCTSFGLPTMIRFSVKKPRENGKLVARLLKLKRLSLPSEMLYQI
ncbi:MAG: aminotransferase class I/II-fold pyridoxal phosphate-dependent enzyme [Nitrososphaerota archaeon]|nr:aminotransferase class I/II-fold pyridoxal phosphate-dependent enzyme [Nitrososphaerota archaeon]MDG6927975.1 aminotransferase class I/II-fold pyridoxal phosphate-dependent enzyme [Nitrososphaerota archaeon]MDG6929644.1 aminotransferase class I/II-fold pyridoxal phosphate-dependent enzyme [Nitrososphaerota archaeon]MDG6932847.1 aminotransferase class I/II-fold pyridoxal phosphate-dependent enzyme [Nitrososphaerota archaeon]MDG6936830.1 aminotransferase class I/II-fold pyridoxal phosphate-dep